MVTDFKLNDVVRLKKVHPCGSFEWQVTRLGADIGLKCKGCGRYILVLRSELARRMKGAPHQEE